MTTFVDLNHLDDTLKSYVHQYVLVLFVLLFLYIIVRVVED